MLSWQEKLWLLSLSIIIICFGYECQLNARKVKIQKLCSRDAQSGAKQTDDSKLSKEKGLFFLSFYAQFFCYVIAASKIPWPLFSSEHHLFTCLVIVQSHCFYHLPTPLTDLAGWHVILKWSQQWYLSTLPQPCKNINILQSWVYCWLNFCG